MRGYYGSLTVLAGGSTVDGKTQRWVGTSLASSAIRCCGARMTSWS